MVLTESLLSEHPFRLYNTIRPIYLSCFCFFLPISFHLFCLRYILPLFLFLFSFFHQLLLFPRISSLLIKVKVKVHPRTGYEGPERD